VRLGRWAIHAKLEALADAHFVEALNPAAVESSENGFPCWIEEFALGHDFYDDDGH
jgi:hypothetical protein